MDASVFIAGKEWWTEAHLILKDSIQSDDQVLRYPQNEISCITKAQHCWSPNNYDMENLEKSNVFLLVYQECYL